MTLLTFEVFGTPQPAGSKRAFNWRARDGRSGTSIVDANPKAKDWKLQVAAAAGAAYQGELLEGPLAIEFVFELPRPKGHFGKRGLLVSAPICPTGKPDVLKLARAVEDALSGIVYRDDSQIVDERLVKRYGERARLTVRVERPWAIEEKPIAPEQPLLIPPDEARLTAAKGAP
jgi:Holliday junction resolvase RusA-like endonuclease